MDSVTTESAIRAGQSGDALTPERLLEMISDEQVDSALCRRLADLARGQARGVLMQLLHDERRHARTAAAMYYILTGKQPGSCAAPVPACAALRRELRLRYDAELRAAQAYETLAGTAGSFGDVFLQLSQDERGHAAAILALLQGGR